MSTNKNRKPWVSAVVLIVLLLGVGAYFYFRPKPKRIRLDQQLVVSGIGLHLAWHRDIHKWQIDRIYPNSPAEKTGLMAGLLLNKVDGKLAETNNLGRLSAMLRGPIGSKVTVELIDTTATTNEIEVVREQFVNHSKRDGDQPSPPAAQ